MWARNLKSAFGRLIFASWGIACTVLFISYPGRISFLHGSDLLGWAHLIPKLIRIQPLGYLVDLTASFFGVVIFFIACASFGAPFIFLLSDNETNNSPSQSAFYAQIATAFLIGSGLFSIFFLILGGAFELESGYTIAITLIGLMLGFRSFMNLFSIHRGKHGHDRFDPTKHGSGQIIYWPVVGIFLLALMYSTSRLGYDSVALYFSNAKITAMAGQIQFFLNDSFNISSMHSGILYTAVIQIFGDQAARMYSWINGLVILIFTLALAEHMGLSERARWILLTLLLTTTAFTDLLGDGKIDLATSAPTIATVYWMLKNGINARNSTFTILGCLAGMAIISRPFNAFLLGIFMGLFYSYQLYSQEKTGSLDLQLLFKRFFWLTSGITSMVLFHLAANWLILGDPLAPFRNASKLSSTGWQWSSDPDELWILRGLYPFAVTFLNSPQSLGTISPLFLAFLPGIFTKDLRTKLFTQKPLTSLTIMAMITLLFWITLFFTVVEIRYVLFLWIILFMPLAVIAEIALDKADMAALVMKIMVVVLLLFINFRIVYISLDTYSPIDKELGPQCFDVSVCEFLKPINQAAANGDRILTLTAYRYYLRPELFACSTRADEYAVLRSASLKGAEAFWEEVYRQGYTFVAYENNYGIRHLYMEFVPQTTNTPDWMRIEPIYESLDGKVVAYKIITYNPPISSERACIKDKAIWKVQDVGAR